MENYTLDSILEDYVKKAGVNEFNKLLYGNGSELIKKYEGVMAIGDNDKISVCEVNESTRNNIIMLGIKKGFIWIDDDNTINFIDNNNQKKDDFYTIAKAVIDKTGNKIQNKINDCSNMINRALNEVVRAGDDIVNVQLSFSNDNTDWSEQLLNHYKEIAPFLHKYYCQLLAYTLFYKADEEKYNIFSRTVREYFESDPEQKEKFLKLYIKSYVKIACQKTNICGASELNKNELENINELGEADKKIVNGLEFKRICFNYQDFENIYNNDEVISEILNDLKNNDEFKIQKDWNQPPEAIIKSAIKLQKLLYDFENYEGGIDSIFVEDNNIDELREKHPKGLHFVVGDLHKCWETLAALLEKIQYDKNKDYIYFLGDYCGGGDERKPENLLNYLSEDFQEDYSQPGFHLILGNHDKEERLLNLPDIVVLRMGNHNYYMAHASFYNKVIDVIYDDMERKKNQQVFTYKLDKSISATETIGTDKYKCGRMKWSKTGTFVPENQDEFIQNTSQSIDEKACIIHGHTPFYYFDANDENKKYGNNSLFWENQKIWFSQDMRSFNLDSNIKGERDDRRALSCICLEVLEEMNVITKKNILRNLNGVFSVAYKKDVKDYSGDTKMLSQVRNCKMITIVDNDLKIVDKEEK